MGKKLAVDSAYIDGVLYRLGDDVPAEAAKNRDHLFDGAAEPDLTVGENGALNVAEASEKDVIAYVGDDAHRAAGIRTHEVAREGGPRKKTLAHLDRVAAGQRAGAQSANPESEAADTSGGLAQPPQVG